MYEQKDLVTGDVGYMGYHACIALNRSLFFPLTFNNLVTDWRYAVKFDPFGQGNLISKAARFSKLLKERGLQLFVSFEN